jgi:hypothetical protein
VTPDASLFFRLGSGAGRGAEQGFELGAGKAAGFDGSLDRREGELVYPRQRRIDAKVRDTVERRDFQYPVLVHDALPSRLQVEMDTGSLADGVAPQIQEGHKSVGKETGERAAR